MTLFHFVAALADPAVACLLALKTTEADRGDRTRRPHQLLQPHHATRHTQAARRRRTRLPLALPALEHPLEHTHYQLLLALPSHVTHTAYSLHLLLLLSLERRSGQRDGTTRLPASSSQLPHSAQWKLDNCSQACFESADSRYIDNDDDGNPPAGRTCMCTSCSRLAAGDALAVELDFPSPMV